MSPSSSLPPLTGDIEQDLSPLTPAVQSTAASKLAPSQPTAPAQPQPGPSQVPSSLFSSPKGFYGPGLLANLESRLTGTTPEQAYAKRVPQLETAVAALAPFALPGGSATSFLSRLGTSAAQGAGISGGLAALGGQRLPKVAKEAALGAGAQAAAVPIGAAARFLTSAIPTRIFGRASGEALARWLRRNIPAFAQFRGPRALYQMAKESEQALSQAFEKEFSSAVSSLPEGATIQLPREAAKAAGLKTFVDVPPVPSGRGFDIPLMTGSAREAAEKALGLGAKNPGARKALIDALSEQAPAGWLPEARRSYMFGKGWQEFARSLFKEGERYDPHIAQRLLRGTPGEALEHRGMTDVRNIIRGPLSTGPLTRYSPSPWAQRVAGLGLLGGGMYSGHPGLSLIGAGLEVMPRVAFYRGVPPTVYAPTLDALRRALAQGGVQFFQGPPQP